MFCDCGLETLYKLLDFCEDGGSSLFVSEWFDDSGVVQKLFEDQIYNALAYLQANFL